MNNTQIGRRVFFAFSILGILNIFLAYFSFYYSSISLIKERGYQQMDSVRALASQKLKLHFDNLKTNAFQNSQDLVRLSTTPPQAIVVDNSDKHYESIVPLTFTPEGEDSFLLKVPVGKKSVIWKYHYKDLNEVLAEYTGLGKTGEIYLVGFDHKIKSASRHVKDWQNITVDNNSIRLSKLYNYGVHTVKDYRNVEVFSAFSIFAYDRLSFVLLSEIDKDEVFYLLKTRFPKVLVICITLCFLSILFAYLSTTKILKLIGNLGNQINDMHTHFINTIEEENRKIAFHLHDGVGQILTSLKWGIGRNEDPEKLKSLCDEAFREIRCVSGDLMPSDLPKIGFYPAVKKFLKKQEAYYGLQVHYWHNERLEKYQFQTGVDVNIYRMIQEFFHNTVKHANATAVSLILFREHDKLVLRFEDDGKGMKEEEPMPTCLQYRASTMGAHIFRVTTPKGMVFQVNIPLKRVFSESNS